jgi:hypothetical protein
MRPFIFPAAVMVLTTTCLAQLSIGGKQIDFGVKRKKPGTPEMKLLGPASYDSGSKLSLQFKVSNFDESKGFHVYTQIPCITSEALEKVGEETYKIDITINPVEIDGECQITMLGLAKSESVTTRVGYKAKHIDNSKLLASLSEFIQHKSWQVKPANGKSYTLNLQMVQPAPADAEVRSAMLKDPQLPLASMMAVQMPNKVSLTRMGCIMEGTFSGSTATLKPSAMLPPDSCPDGPVVIQGN